MKNHSWLCFFFVLLTILICSYSFGTVTVTSESIGVITSLEQADALVRSTQSQFWQLVPPSMFRYIHSDKQVRPVVWSKGWPNELKKQMYAEMQRVNGAQYPLYTLWAVEDRYTGDLIYFNVKGDEVYRYQTLPPIESNSIF